MPQRYKIRVPDGNRSVKARMPDGKRSYKAWIPLSCADCLTPNAVANPNVFNDWIGNNFFVLPDIHDCPSGEQQTADEVFAGQNGATLTYPSVITGFTPNASLGVSVWIYPVDTGRELALLNEAGDAQGRMSIVTTISGVNQWIEFKEGTTGVTVDNPFVADGLGNFQFRFELLSGLDLLARLWCMRVWEL